MKTWIIQMPDDFAPGPSGFKWLKEMGHAVFDAVEAIEVPVPVDHVFSVVFETDGKKTDWTATKLYAVKEPTK